MSLHIFVVLFCTAMSIGYLPIRNNIEVCLGSYHCGRDNNAVNLCIYFLLLYEVREGRVRADARKGNIDIREREEENRGFEGEVCCA